MEGEKERRVEEHVARRPLAQDQEDMQDSQPLHAPRLGRLGTVRLCRLSFPCALH